MADVFKPTYTRPIPQGAELFTRKGKAYARFCGANGKVRAAPVAQDGEKILLEQEKFAGYYRDYHGKRRKVSLCRDRSASRSAWLRLLKIVELLRAGRPAPPIDDVPPIIRDVVERALEDSGQASKAYRLCRDPIEDHLEDYLSHLESSGATAKHRQEAERCIETVIEACRFATLAEVEIAPLVRFVNDKKKEGASARTTNVYCDRLHAFVRWAVKTGRLETDPLVGMTRRNERKDRKRTRRPLTPEEIAKLMDAAYRRPLEQQVLGHRGKKLTDEQRRLMGEERRLIYALMFYTGLRVGEVSKVTWADIELESDRPVLMVREAVSKNAQKAALPLHPWLVSLLTEWKARNGAATAVGVVVKVPSSMRRILDKDLAYAGIDKCDASGRTVDLHACRHTFISLLASLGVHPRVAQRLARHSKIDMTMSVYTHLYLGDDARAVEALPSPEIDLEKEDLRATGTLDEKAVERAHVRPHVQKSVHAGYTGRHWQSRSCAHGGAKGGTGHSRKFSSRKPQDTKKARQSSPDCQADKLGRTGLEPVTSCVSSRRSSHLS